MIEITKDDKGEVRKKAIQITKDDKGEVREVKSGQCRVMWKGQNREVWCKMTHLTRTFVQDDKKVLNYDYTITFKKDIQDPDEAERLNGKPFTNPWGRLD